MRFDFLIENSNIPLSLSRKKLYFLHETILGA